MSARVVVVLLLVLAAAPCAKAQWMRFDSSHLAIVTDNESVGRTTIQGLEDARNALSALGLPVPETRPMTIFLVSKQKDLENIWPVGRGDVNLMRGLAEPFEDHIYVVADIGHPYAQKNILHEFVHALIGQSLTGLPRWIDEGLAEHYSTLVFQNGNVSLGPLDARRRWSQGSCSSSMSLRETISWPPDSLRHTHVGPFYLSSALNVRYLVEKFGIGKVFELLGSFQGKGSYDLELQRIFHQTPEEIDIAATNWCKSRNPNAPVAVFAEGAKYSRHDLSPKELQDLFAELLARIPGRQDLAMETFLRDLKANGGDFVAHRGLGIALAHKSDFDGAVAHLKIALSKSPRDVTSMFYLVVTCSQSASCVPEAYADDVKRLLEVRPDLRTLKEWSLGLEVEPTTVDNDAMGFLPDLKDEVSSKRKK